MPMPLRNVIFVAAAGPTQGYGHLVRCGHLASALGTRRVVALRGPKEAVWTAVRMGWTVLRTRPSTLCATDPDLLVIDDADQADVRRWVRAARRAGVPVATMHDGGGVLADADLIVDGSFTAAGIQRAGGHYGPAWAVIDSRVAMRRDRRLERRRRHVLIALGGGAHVRALGAQLATAISRKRPDVSVAIAAGFCDGATLPALPDRCEWLLAPDGLADAFARASVAVVAGGVTMYEACASGTPTVALPVVPAQQPAIHAASLSGAVVSASTTSVSAAVDDLIAHPMRASALGRRARRLVDGQGASRVVRSLYALAGRAQAGGVDHAA